MASHLTITSTAPGAGTRGIAASTGAAEEGVADVFAALLGTAGAQPGTETSKSSSANSELSLGNIVNLSLGFGSGEGTADESEDPQAVAAVIDAVVPVQDLVQSVPMFTDLANTLADLKTRLAAGEPLDPEALKQLESMLTDIADAFGIDLGALPSLDDLTALVTDIQPDDMSFAARLTAAFGPVAETLLSGDAAPEAEAGVELSALVKSIGDKLAALLSALNSGAIAPDQIAQLELAAEADADLDAALAKLAQSVLTVETGDAAPTLATPELKLTEPALTGKATTPDTARPETTETTQTAEAAAPVAAAGEQDDATPERGNDNQERKPAEQRPVAAATTIDKQPEPQQAQQPVQAARVDIVAAPRVVQAGYQTSQQQLNLPQLAFELVRQVNDGNTRFQIRLDPPELGKIDVKLDIDQAGQVNARLTVEKAETLDLMQRDQRGLERALQQAGLDSAKTNLEFSLRQNPFSGQQGDERGNGNGRNPLFGDDTAEVEDTPPPTVNLYRGSLSASGVNIIA